MNEQNSLSRDTHAYVQGDSIKTSFKLGNSAKLEHNSLPTIYAAATSDQLHQGRSGKKP